MATKNNIRRNYLIIKRILQDNYPSAETIMKSLEFYDSSITLRTFQRDLANIRSNFDIDIIYNPQKNGYYIENQSDLSKLLYFIELAESSDIVLQSLKDKKDILQYLSISPLVKSKGIEHISTLLLSIKNRVAVQFNHLNYQTEEIKDYIVEPYLLKEFDGRWYLFAFVKTLGSFRTFGLDRISDIVLMDNTFERKAELVQTAEKFENVYGLVYEQDQNKNAPLEKVSLRFSPLMVKHLFALPLHHSQTINDNVITLQVIVNPELENKILSYGENVEVLSPQSLRDKIKERLTNTIQQY